MRHARPTGKQRVMIAEDQAVVAMLMETDLVEAGFAVVGPFASCAEASEWLRGDTPDYAILDLRLRDGPCTQVAEELRRRGAGFAVFSGSMQADAPAIFGDAPWFDKPSDLARLIASLHDLMAGRGSGVAA